MYLRTSLMFRRFCIKTKIVQDSWVKLSKLWKHIDKAFEITWYITCIMLWPLKLRSSSSCARRAARWGCYSSLIHMPQFHQYLNADILPYISLMGFWTLVNLHELTPAYEWRHEAQWHTTLSMLWPCWTGIDSTGKILDHTYPKYEDKTRWTGKPYDAAYLCDHLTVMGMQSGDLARKRSGRAWMKTIYPPHKCLSISLPVGLVYAHEISGICCDYLTRRSRLAG